MKLLAGIIITVLLGGVILVLGVLALPRIDRHLTIQAIEKCGKLSAYKQQVSESVEVVYPIEDIYGKCLQESGVRG